MLRGKGEASLACRHDPAAELARERLEDEAWVAVSALVEKSKAATIMDSLEAAGATDILLSAIHSSRMGD